MFAALLAITLVAGVWFFLFRASGPPSSDFTRAERRYVQAVQTLEAATSAVTFVGNSDYQLKYQSARDQMQAQLAEFQRLATSEEGEASDIATDAARSAQLGISAAETLLRALYKTKISDADRARDQLADAIREIQQDGKAWEEL